MQLTKTRSTGFRAALFLTVAMALSSCGSDSKSPGTNAVVPGNSTVHIAADSLISGNYASLELGALDAQTSAVLLLTQNWKPNSIYNSSVVGLWHTSLVWSVFNQDLLNLPVNSAYNLYVPGSEDIAFVHEADSNSTSHVTVIDHPDMNGNPDLIPFITQNWNPPGQGGTYNANVVGIYYTGSNWAIFNQNIQNLPSFASFNVVVPADASKVFIHDAVAATISGNFTRLNHPDLNDNPDAIVTVSHNWNPNGQSGVYNEHELGVWYTGSQWSIFHQDLTDFVENSSFSVLIGGEPAPEEE